MVRWQSLSCEPHKCVERKDMVTLQSRETPTQCGSLSASCILVDQVVAKKHITIYSHDDEKPEYKASYVSFMNIYIVNWYSHTSIPVQGKLEQNISSLYLCDQVVSCFVYQRQVSSNKTKDAPTAKRPPSASLHGAKKSRGLFANIPVLWLVVPTIVMTTLAFVVVFTERWASPGLASSFLDLEHDMYQY